MSLENQNNIIKIYLGERLKMSRKVKEISLRDLAIKTGISEPYLVRLENNVITNPSVKTFNKICKALDLSDSDILKIFDSLDIKL